ncbi:MAG: hypothetical protein AAGC44_04325 [Planctomycetota bacterium]
MTRTLQTLMLAALLLPMLAAAPTLGQAINPEDATEADGLRFQQERAIEHMRELEERMFRLAELLKESQPEDALRLTMGFERSRDKLVTERMRDVGRMIGDLELTEASARLEQVITELEAIKKLLLTADLELALKMEQLRKINQALEDLEKIAAQEAANQNQSDALASQANPNANAMEMLGNAEERNADATDELENRVGDINPESEALQQAQEALGQAQSSMSQAASQLSQSQSPGSASQSQSQAQQQLQEAKEALEQARDELQKEVEKKVRDQVMENLQAMLSQQTDIREALEVVGPDADRGAARGIAQVRGLVEPEQAIIELANQTIELCEQTEFSVALPAALSAVRDRMAFLVDDYTAGLGGPPVIAATIRVEQDLQALVDAMELSNKNQEPKEPNPNESPRDKEAREMNQMLAELRMLKIMQVATNENVIRLDQAREQGDLAPTELRRREEMARDQQERVREATVRLGEVAANGG